MIQKSSLWSIAAAEFTVLVLNPEPKNARGFHVCLHLVELLEVSGEDPFVVLALQRGHFHPQDTFILRRQGLLHILDHTPQQVRTQLCMQFAYLWHNHGTINENFRVQDLFRVGSGLMLYMLCERVVFWKLRRTLKTDM